MFKVKKIFIAYLRIFFPLRIISWKSSQVIFLSLVTHFPISLNHLLKTSIPIVSLAKQICEFNYDNSISLFKSLLENSKRLISEKDKDLIASKKFFDGVSPKQQLKRGFAIIRDSKNKVITRAKSISAVSYTHLTLPTTPYV